MMQRPCLLLTLLAASVLFAGGVQAQRGGGAARGGSVARGRAGASVGHRNLRRGISSMRSRVRSDGDVYPLWYGEPFWDDEPYAYEEEDAAMPAPQGMIVQPGRLRPASRQLPPASPKVIEVQGAVDSATAKAQPLAMFVLTNGERLEVRRYLLTHDTLYLTVDHQERSIPLTMLDINATTAANHERGVDMRIPAGRSEISLSF